MGYVLLGILAGIGLPVQTSVNNRLKPRVGGPERTSLISFFVGSVFLLLWVLATEGTARLPVDRTAGYPFWIWTGGAFGVCFLLGNLFLISRVGSANTVIYPVVGQIIMGLLVDHFGWFMSDVQKLTILRAMGGALVLVGMLVITGTGKEAGTESRPGSWQAPVIGIGIGALSAAQTAINARLGTALDNPIQAALVSFSVGTVLLLMICLLPGVRKQPAGEEHIPVWTWLGGVLGAFFVLSNLFVAGRIGTGIAVVASLTGTVAGGLIIDQFGWLGTPVRRITARKGLGLLLMMAGVIMVRLL